MLSVERTKRFLKLVVLLINPVFNIKSALYAFPRYILFIKDLIEYSKLPDAEKISLLELTPRLHDRNSHAGTGDALFYQDTWAFRRIYENAVEEHVDVGSCTLFVGMLSTITKVTFIDIRPYSVNLDNLEFKRGDILHLPFEDASIKSLSCLHTIEHIGLGRYGDTLDPNGSKKAIKELQRVMALEGNLYLAVPVGRPGVRFNKSRVFSPDQIIEEFDELELIELSGIGPEKMFHRNIDSNILANLEYGLGLFWFKRSN